MTDKQLDRFLEAAERMHLADYVAFESDRKRRLIDAFWQGVVRGIGIMIGFSVLGALLLLILKSLAQKNLPLIGSFIAQVVELVQMRLK